jgi:hypothetical protein
MIIELILYLTEIKKLSFFKMLSKFCCYVSNTKFSILSKLFFNLKSIKVIMSYSKLNWNTMQFKSANKLTNYKSQYTELNMTQ